MTLFGGPKQDGRCGRCHQWATVSTEQGLLCNDCYRHWGGTEQFRCVMCDRTLHVRVSFMRCREHGLGLCNDCHERHKPQESALNPKARRDVVAALAAGERRG